MQTDNRWNRAAALVGAVILFTLGDVSPVAAQSPTATLKGVGPSPDLAAPQPSQSATKFAEVIGWPDNLTPKAPEGFRVEAFARDLDSPRWLYVLPNGDVLVSQARSHPSSGADPKKRKGLTGAGSIGVSPNRITLLRDADKDGRAETRDAFLTNLNQPLGVVLIDGHALRREHGRSDAVSLQERTDENRGSRHSGIGAASRRLQQSLDQEHCRQCQQIEAVHFSWIGQ